MKPPIIIQLIVVLWCSCHAWRTFKIIVEDSSIEYDERYVNVSIAITKSSQNESLLSMYVTVLEDIDNLMAQISLTAKTAGNEELNLLNGKGNFCRFLAGRKDGNVRIFFDYIQKFGKTILECPVRKGSYYLQDFKIDPDLTPDYLPEATFLATAFIYIQEAMAVQKSIVKINVTGKIDKSQGLDSIKLFSLG